MKKNIQRTIIIVSVIIVIGLFAFFLKSILIPFIKFELKHDVAGAHELLREKGIFGFFAVAIVEALQMVVVFIPAEFIQISSGLSYPFPIALLLCDIGVCLGATIIYILVKNFKFSSKAYDRNKKKIDMLSAEKRSDKGIVLFMFFLFFMPFIPFGAICYYASNTGIKYGKYLLTVATGVIPSIVTSNLMGVAGKEFIRNSIPIPILIIIILLLAAMLIVIIFVFLEKFYFKENDGTPDSVVYTAIVSVFKKMRQGRHLTVNNELLEAAEPPYFMLINHESFYDFSYLVHIKDDLRAVPIVNEYYLKKPVLSYLSRKIGIIPKKLFTSDLHTIGGIIGAVKRGYPVVVFPEGRLSTSGAANPIAENSGAFYKKMNKDIVLVKISGAYYAKPKWRKKYYKSNVRLSVDRVIKKDELANMTADMIDDAIRSALYYNEPSGSDNVYKQKNKAKGLENILYRCIDCGSLYTTEGKGCELICHACGSVHKIGTDYRFTDGTSIADYYGKLADMEREQIDGTVLQTDVNVKIFNDKGKARKCRGICRLDKNDFSFSSDAEEFTIPTKDIPALAYSCNEEFELYHKGELHYFYPVNNRRQTVRWALLIDILTEMRYEKERNSD